MRVLDGVGMGLSDEGVFPRSLEDDHVDAVQFAKLGFSRLLPWNPQSDNSGSE